MTSGCTIVTPLQPDPEAIVQLLADLDPTYRVFVNAPQECWEVIHPTRDVVLLVIDQPRHVRVPGEVERIFGSDLGFSPEILADPRGLHWLDIHLVDDSEDAERLLVLFARNMSERGHGSYVEHGPELPAFPAGTIGLGWADTPDGWDLDAGRVVEAEEGSRAWS